MAIEQLELQLDGFSGPLDLLLDLARRQKVDLRQISMQALCDQYLEYMANLRGRRIEIAAEYLVMAAWLTYLKSKLLLPVSDKDTEDDAEMMALYLAHRLERLDAMRQSVKRLFARSLLHQDRFVRGQPEPMVIHDRATYDVTLLELVRAYGRVQLKQNHSTYEVKRPKIYTMDIAMENLRQVLGQVVKWRSLQDLLPSILADAEPDMQRSVVAGTFAATLELVRQGQIELRQAKAFAPIEVRVVRRDIDV